MQKVLKGNLNVRQTEALVEKTLKENGKLDKKKPRIVIVNDVRIYLNSIREIMETVKTSGIPASMEQDMDGDDVVLTLRIKNVKREKTLKLLSFFNTQPVDNPVYNVYKLVVSRETGSSFKKGCCYIGM